MSASQRWGRIGVLALGAVATMMTATTVNVALAPIAGAFGLGQDEAQWLSTAFLATSTGALLLNGWAVSRAGMRGAFCLAMAIFIAGSLAGAIAQDLAALVASRVMQGAGAGLIQPMAVYLIYTAFPDNRRGTALGVYSLCVIVSPAFGPAVGGFLIDAFDWRIVFVATVPLALLAIPAAIVLLPGRDAAALPTRPDLPGVLLVMAAIAFTIQGLAHGRREGWDDAGTAIRLALAAASLAAFLAWEARHPTPALDLRLFRRPGFSLAGLAIFASGAAIYASTYLAPLFVQVVQHFSSSAAGELLIPAGITMAICFPLAGRLSDHADSHLLLFTGMATFGVSMLLLADAASFTDFASLAFALALGRAGVGLTMPAANASAMAHAKGMLAQAAPATTFLSQTGGALGVAAVSVLLEERTAFHADALRPMINGANTQVSWTLQTLAAEAGAAGLTAADAQALALRQLGGTVWSSAQLHGFRDCFFALGAGFLCLAPLVLFLAPARATLAADRSNFIDRVKRTLTLLR